MLPLILLHGVVPVDTFLIIESAATEYAGTSIQCVVTFLVNSEACNSSAAITLEVIGRCCE